MLCNFVKILMYDKIYPIVNSQISQHGFIQKRSTTLNLISFTQHISTYLNTRGQVNVIYTDQGKEILVWQDRKAL